MKIQHKIQAGFAVALAFLILTGVSAWWSAQRSAEAFRAADHAHRVLEQLEGTLVGMLNMETGGRGFAISGDEKFLEPYQDGIIAVQKSFAAAKRLTRDDPNQQRRLIAIEPSLQKKIGRVNEVVRLCRSGDTAGAFRFIASGQGRQAMNDIRAGIAEMEIEEHRLLQQHAARAQVSSRMTISIVAISGLLTVGLVALASVIVRRDFEKRQRAEEALRRSEENLAVTLHSIGDAVLATDAGGRVTRMNPVAEKLTGWTQAGALGRQVAEVFHIINEETREPAVIPVDDVLTTGEIHGLANHTIIIARDGTERPIADSAAPIRDKDGQILGVVLVFRDVTEEKKAEKLVRESASQLRILNEDLERRVAERAAEMHQALATLDAMEDAALIFDPETLRHTYVNEGAVRQLGYTRKELLGMTALNFKPEFTEARYREMLAPMLRGEARSHRFTTLHRHKDGHDFPVEIHLEYIRPAGERPRFIATSHDITERQKHERLALRSQRLEAIGTLAGGVAHDLNNALAPIMMGVEMLKMEYPKESKTVDMFEASAKRGADMVRQLLTFAKGAEGERVALQPGRLVKELENLIKGSFPKNIQLAIKCDPKLPMVLGDATQLHQVLLNLCVNARDAMPHGGALTLEAQRAEVDAVYASSVPDAKPGNYVALRVRDTGSGIPPEILDRIFDPFFTTKGPDKGTGLGLSTVMGIVKGHGGFLQVYSQPGQGSTFTVYLPVSSAGSDTEQVTKAAVEFRGQGETILFVDDEPAVRLVARAVLQRLNFKPLTATDGADGLMQAAQHRTELRAIITDLHMPHMDGLAFVRALRRMLPDLPIMVASGRMEDALAEEFKTLGVTNRLDKPFTEVQLAEALKNLLAPK